jgi:hypothetical protein
LSQALGVLLRIAPQGVAVLLGLRVRITHEGVLGLDDHRVIEDAARLTDAEIESRETPLLRPFDVARPTRQG